MFDFPPGLRFNGEDESWVGHGEKQQRSPMTMIVKNPNTASAAEIRKRFLKMLQSHNESHHFARQGGVMKFRSGPAGRRVRLFRYMALLETDNAGHPNSKAES